MGRRGGRRDRSVRTQVKHAKGANLTRTLDDPVEVSPPTHRKSTAPLSSHLPPNVVPSTVNVRNDNRVLVADLVELRVYCEPVGPIDKSISDVMSVDLLDEEAPVRLQRVMCGRS